MAEQGPAVSATEPEIIALKNPVKERDRGRDAYCYAPTGWPEVVTHLRLPQNPACRFPALLGSPSTHVVVDGIKDDFRWQLQLQQHKDSQKGVQALVKPE
jgi:hypothetical protein